jgi:heptose-I-phosphate ethanolaminephosphotransferase
MLSLKNIYRPLNLFFYPIKNLFPFFFFMYLLGITCSWIEVPISGMRQLYEYRYIELFIDIYALCVLLCLIPRKIRPEIKGLIYILIYSITIIDVYCYLRFDSTITPTMLQLALETNSNEASEFLTSYFSFDIIYSGLGWILLILLLHILCAMRGWINTKFDNKYIQFLYSILETLKKRIYTAQPYLGVVVIVLLAFGIKPCIDNKLRIHKLLAQERLDKIEKLWNRSYGDGLYLPVYKLIFAIHANKVSIRQIDKLTASIHKVKVDSCTFRSSNIVLIIGESYNKHHSELFGYKKKTTPRQVRRARHGNLTPFNNVVTPWNLTSSVFKDVFSMHGIGDKGEWSDYPLFTQVFKKAGYHVTFITNQFVQKANDKPSDFSGGYFLNNKALSESQFDSRNISSHEFDEGLLADYDSLEDENGKHNLIIFHLIGQHVGYEKRYPADRLHFDYNDYDRKDLSRSELKILRDYDNATLYNDSVVDAIIKKFEHTDAIIIYMPDHAEECFDDLHNFGRMQNARLFPRMVRQEFEIPFWIWCSHDYVRSHPDIYQEVILARHRPFMTDNLPQMLVYLAGIHCPYYKPENNLLSPIFNEKRPRLLKGNVDYDTLMTQFSKDEKRLFD